MLFLFFNVGDGWSGRWTVVVMGDGGELNNNSNNKENIIIEKATWTPSQCRLDTSPL